MPEASANGNYSQYLGYGMTPPFTAMGAPQFGPQGPFGGSFGNYGGNAYLGGVGQPHSGQTPFGAYGAFPQQQVGQAFHAGAGGMQTGQVTEQVVSALSLLANHIATQIPVAQQMQAVLSQLAHQIAQQSGHWQQGTAYAAPIGHFAYGQTGQAGTHQIAWNLSQLANQLAQQAQQIPGYAQAGTQQIAWNLGQLANQLAQQARFAQANPYAFGLGQQSFGGQERVPSMGQGQAAYWSMPLGQGWGGIRPAMV